MRTPKQYDLSELNSFFNEVITPDQQVSELVDLLFDYALSFDEDNTKAFKKGSGYDIYPIPRANQNKGIANATLCKLYEAGYLSLACPTFSFIK